MKAKSPMGLSDTKKEEELNAIAHTHPTAGMVQNLHAGTVLVFAVDVADVVRSCGGALMRHTLQGDGLQVIIVGDPIAPVGLLATQAAPRTTQDSNQNALARMGIDTAEYWRMQDSAIEYGEPMVQRVLDALSACATDLVYVPSVFETDSARHALAMSVMEAVRRKGGSLKLAMGEAKNSIGAHHATESFYVITAKELEIDHIDLFRLGRLHQAAARPLNTAPNVPTVSVVIRSMDRDQLQDALDSLAFQTYPDLEILVVNTRGSTHRAIGTQCGRFPMRLLETACALKPSAAANAGLDGARGQYLMFLGDGDWLAPNHISGLVAALTANRASKIAYAGVGIRSDDRTDTGREPLNAMYSPARLRWENFIPLHAVLFDRSLLECGVRFDDAFDAYGDWDFLLQSSQVSAFVHVDAITAYCRADGMSGAGIQADTDAPPIAKGQVFDKWKQRWSGAELAELLQSRVDCERAAQARLDAGLQGARQDANEAPTMAQTMEVRLHALSRQNDALKGQLEHAERDMRRLEGRLYDLLHSSSWRLAAPVRYLVRRVHTAKRVVKGGFPGLVIKMLEGQPWPGGDPQVTQGFRGEAISEPSTSNAAPLISVVMPVYNACRADKRFFLRALESIANQTYAHVELIVVDDGSTDQSREVFNAFKAQNPGLRALYLTKENGGQSSARNFGVQASSGEYIGFLDQDDEWYEDKLARVVPWLQNKEIDVLYTDSDSIDGDDKITYDSIHRQHFCGWPHPKKSIEDVLFKDIFVMPGLMTIKREAFESIGGFDARLSGYEDDDLFLRLYEKFNVFYLPISTLRWRMYGDNYSFSHRMLSSRTYFWKKLMANYGNTKFRRAMISMRFFAQFFSQAVAQFQAKNDLCWKSLAGAREILPYLPRRQRMFFSVVLRLPDKRLLPYLARAKGKA